jgi:PKD repeat protein
MRKINLSLFLVLAILCMSLAAPVCADDLGSGLVGWWRGEGNGNDSAGSNNGTLNGGATYAAGRYGQAFSLDGSSGYIQLADSSALKPEVVTVGAWIKLASSPSGNAIIFDNESAEPWYGYLLYIVSGNKLNAEVYTSSASTTVAGNMALLPDTWYHVAMTYDGANIKTYINGREDGSVPSTGLINYSVSVNPTIGKRSVGVSGYLAYFPGLIDEVRVYNRALNASEVYALASTDFIAQTQMPLSTSIVSNPVTFSFIAGDSSISVSGGEYSVSTNGGSTWSTFSTTTPSTISPNNQVKVRQTSSASNSATTTATLTIGSITKDFSVTTAASGDPNASGLIAWWKAENNIYDSVGGNHGTALNGATYATGKVGQAFSFDGVDDYVQVAAPVGLPTGSSERTISVWFKTPRDLTSSPNSCIIIYGTGEPGKNFSLITNESAPGKLFFAGNYSDLAGTTTMSPDTWYHGAVTYDGITLKLYLNGSLENSAALSLDTVLNGNGLTIGRYLSDPADIWEGQIDEVKIYSRALSASEVKNLAGKPDDFSFTAQTGMPLSTAIVSNPITVTGISSSSPISISGNSGEYSISTDSGSTWSSFSSTTPATVSLNDMVKVRQTSSSSNSTLTTTTLNIGGATADFNVTTAASGDPNASGLIAWWKAENNAYDSVGGNHGTAVNGATYADGKINRAFSFDGVDDRVEAAGGVGDFGSNPFTVSFWMKSNNDGSSDPTFIIGKNHANGGRGWDIRLSNNSIRVVGVNGWGFNITSDASATTGTWHHVALASTADTANLYIDGVLKGTSQRGTISSTSNPFRIGFTTDYGSPAFNGLIDEVKIYNRALSATEVSKLAGTYPDAFTFTDRTNIAKNTAVESNAITVTGISNPAAISISGNSGVYAISTNGGSSWGDWTSSAGTVNLNDQVKVRQTSSSSYSTKTDTALTIGGVSDTFSVTTCTYCSTLSCDDSNQCTNDSCNEETGCVFTPRTGESCGAGGAGTCDSSAVCQMPKTLTVTKAGTGSGTVTSSPSGIDCGSTCSAQFTFGATVDLTATPDAGSVFDSWSGACSGSSCSVTMTEARAATATFNSKTDFTGTPLTGQVPLNVSFTDTSTHSPTSWAWTFGDGGTSTVKNPVHTYRSNGTYEVTLTATGTGGASTMTKTGYVVVSGICGDWPYKINGSSHNYADVQTAYDSMGSETMQIQALVLSGNAGTGNLLLDQSKDVTLKGGYDCGFTANPGYTIINDKMTIKDGKATIEKIIIK